MKIAFLADGAHPNCFRWAEHYARLGATVCVFEFREAQADRSGVSYRPLRAPIRSSKVRYLVSSRAARRALRDWAPDLLIGYRIVSYGFLAARTGIHPLVLAGQGQNLIPPGAPPFAERMVRWAIRRADLLHAWSPRMAERMIELGAAPERILARPRGIRLDRWREGGARSRRPSLLSTRQLEPYYNQRLLIEALSEIRARFPDVELVLAGAGSDEAHLKKMATERGLEANVRFPGVLGQDAVVRELQSAWTYVSAVPTDGVSSSLLEAMACGTYPVVVDNRSNRDWIRSAGQGGLFRQGDAAALAAEVCRAVCSETLRADARRINREIVAREADWERNMRDFLKAYDGLLCHPRPDTVSSLRQVGGTALGEARNTPGAK